MTERRFYWWYDLFVYQIAEDEIQSERKKGDPVLTGKALERKVKKKIQEWRDN